VPNPIARLFHRVATGNPRVRAALTPLGPLLMLGLFAGILALSRAADRAFDLPALPPRPLNLLLGLPLVLAGAPLVAWSARRFFAARGTPVPFNPPRELVATGPYAHARNPMMTGLFAVLFGVGILRQSPAMVCLVVPAFVALMYLQIRLVEEPELELRFGEAYREYRRRTPRFMPRLR